MAGKWKQEWLKPVMAMVMLEIAIGGVNILYKLATNDGMSVKIMIAYRMLFAAVSMVPLALIVEWNSRPKLTRRIFFLGFLIGIFGGSLSQNLYCESLVLTSATFVSAMTNLIPAVTFFMALVLRMESLSIETNVGKAKVVGTTLSIAGAMILTFYKGREIKLWSSRVNLLHHRDFAVSEKSSENQALGGFLGVASAVSMAVWMILQGVVVSGLMVALMAWVARRRGALFIASFHPLLLIIVALAGFLMLDEKLHFGSLLGAMFIVLGLYSVLWGKNKEMKNVVVED